ncbi:MAG: ogr/Delta-like zinc finger family protein [Candidatus Accumulibacter sp.]|nr:ogr/Delta-like zinc finger family protein [Accumulibacter sp.]
MRITCPHCRHATVIRTSRAASRLTRESQCDCRNPDCGHVFRAVTEVVETIVPSGTPDPSVFIPSIFVRIGKAVLHRNGA